MPKLPDGFVYCLTNNERLTLFSPEHKQIIDHLLSDSKKPYLFYDRMNEIDILFQRHPCLIYGHIPIEQYYGQWHNFLFLLVKSIYYHSKSELSCAERGNDPVIVDRKKRTKEATTICEKIKHKADDIHDLLYELHSITTRHDVQQLSEIPNYIEWIDKIYHGIDSYHPSNGYYMHKKEPKSIAKYNTFIEYFFYELENLTRMGVINQEVNKLGCVLWRDVLGAASNLNDLSEKDIENTKSKQANSKI